MYQRDASTNRTAVSEVSHPHDLTGEPGISGGQHGEVGSIPERRTAVLQLQPNAAGDQVTIDQRPADHQARTSEGSEPGGAETLGDIACRRFEPG